LLLILLSGDSSTATPYYTNSITRKKKNFLNHKFNKIQIITSRASIRQQNKTKKRRFYAAADYKNPNKWLHNIGYETKVKSIQLKYFINLKTQKPFNVCEREIFDRMKYSLIFKAVFVDKS